MELSSELLNAICWPGFVLKREALERSAPGSLGAAGPAWSDSAVNPAKRVDTLNTSGSRWNVDGATAFGTQFFIAPLGAIPNLVPLRIDVFIPDQSLHPPCLRSMLGSSLCAAVQNGAAAHLGISKHLCRALDSYCDRNPDFLKQYLQLPFGSGLLFHNIAANVAEMKLSVVPGYDLERRLKSVATLRREWATEHTSIQWPQVLDLSDLRFVRQLHDSISVVRLVREDAPPPKPPPENDGQFIFKSSTDNVEHLYHELKFLLTCPPHRNIIPAPIYLVVKRCAFGGKRGVVGFILPLYEHGSIRDLLPAWQRDGSLTLERKIQWCIDVTTALIHIRERCNTFYSDLRPDNVLLDTDGDGQHVVLCDFEQRGNHFEWCPPEILYPKYVESLVSTSRSMQTVIPERWLSLVKSYLHSKPLPEQSPAPVYPEKGPWSTLSGPCQERAQVYTLGLFIYCIFEGLSDVTKGAAYAYLHEPQIEFPQMLHTPPAVQHLIRRCTYEAPEWNSLLEENPRGRGRHVSSTGRVVRRDDKLFAEIPTASASTSLDGTNVLEVAFQEWSTKLEDARGFFESEEWKTAGYGNERPTLREVLAQLDMMKSSNCRTRAPKK